jgi:hypothetical protein
MIGPRPRKPGSTAAVQAHGRISWKLRRDDNDPDGRTRRLDLKIDTSLAPDRKARLERELRAILFQLYEEQRGATALAALELPAASRLRPWFVRFLARLGAGRPFANRKGKILPTIHPDDRGALDDAEGQGRR